MSVFSKIIPRIGSSITSCRPGVSMKFRSIMTYTKEHEWIARDAASDIVTVGVTDHAQKSIGRVVFLDLSAVGSQVTKGDSIGMVESSKTASDIYSPVSGKIVQVNEELQEQVSLLNKSPEDEGWVVKIHMDNPKELDSTLSLEEYKSLTGE